MTTAYIGLGSNMGDRLRNLARAADAIEHLPETHVEKLSHAYESAAALFEAQPDFLNAVAELTTGLEPEALLGHLLDIEDDMGRVRDLDKGPRIIDLDVLLFGSEEISSADLVVPHPGLAERDFVVTPLLEIAPRLVLPDGTHLKRSAADVGLVLRDLGVIPPPNVEHNMPLGDVEWVPVAQGDEMSGSVAGFDAGLQLKRDALDDDGIPYAFTPFEPGTDMDPFGLPVTFTLVVPAGHFERASALLKALETAPLEFPEGYEP